METILENYLSQMMMIDDFLINLHVRNCLNSVNNITILIFYDKIHTRLSHLLVLQSFKARFSLKTTT